MSDDFKEINPQEAVADAAEPAEAPRQEDAKEKKGLSGAGGVLRVAKNIFSPDKILGLGLTLFLITAVTALLLAFVNKVTAPTIAKLQEEAAAEAMMIVLPADSYEPIEETLFSKAVKDGQLIGFCARAYPAGYGGAISMMVGVDLNGKVTGISVIKMSETPGLGTKVTSEAWFLEQFVGKGPASRFGDGLDAISGSTISSNAVLKGVSDSVQGIMSYLSGETEAEK